MQLRYTNSQFFLHFLIVYPALPPHPHPHTVITAFGTVTPADDASVRIRMACLASGVDGVTVQIDFTGYDSVVIFWKKKCQVTGPHAGFSVSTTDATSQGSVPDVVTNGITSARAWLECDSLSPGCSTRVDNVLRAFSIPLSFSLSLISLSLPVSLPLHISISPTIYLPFLSLARSLFRSLSLSL